MENQSGVKNPRKRIQLENLVRAPSGGKSKRGGTNTIGGGGSLLGHIPISLSLSLSLSLCLAEASK